MLKPTTATSQVEVSTLIAMLAGMMTRGDIKLIKGSLYDTLLDVEFKVKGTSDRWSLRGVNDSHGNVTLSKV
jgi:hypothetical protein